MREHSASAVIDSGPLIALTVCGALECLHEMWKETIIPSTVADEVVYFTGTQRKGFVEILFPSWATVLSVAPHPDLLASLGPGESGVITIAMNHKDVMAIIDEKRARKVCTRFGIPVLGTLGILVRAKRMALIPQVQPLIQRLQDSGIFLHEDLVARALAEAEEDHF